MTLFLLLYLHAFWCYENTGCLSKVYVICHEIHCFQSCLVTLQMYCGSYKWFSSQIIDQCLTAVHCLEHYNGNCKIRRTACGKMARYHKRNTLPILQYSRHPEYCVCCVCVWHVKPKIIQIWVTPCCGISSINVFYRYQFNTINALTFIYLSQAVPQLPFMLL